MTDQKPLRLWPGVMFAVAMVVLYFAAPMVLPDAELPVGLMGMMVGAIGILFWWLFFSRAPWVERIGAILLMIVAVFVTRPLVHPSISGAGQGMLIYILPVPVFMLALVIWAAATRRLGTGAASRRAGSGDCARVRALLDHPNRRGQHPGVAVPLALDADG